MKSLECMSEAERKVAVANRIKKANTTCWMCDDEKELWEVYYDWDKRRAVCIPCQRLHEKLAKARGERP